MRPKKAAAVAAATLVASSSRSRKEKTGACGVRGKLLGAIAGSNTHKIGAEKAEQGTAAQTDKDKGPNIRALLIRKSCMAS